MKNNVFFYLLTVCVLFTLKVKSQNYDPNFFPIGVWSIKGDFRTVDDFLYNVNTAAAYHHQSFQNLKNEGFNSVFLAYDPIGYTLDTILDIAEMNQMKVIPSMQHLSELIENSNYQTVTNADITQAIENDSINRIKQSSAVLGYYLYDEPLPGWIDFNVLHNAKNILTNMTADHPHPILSVWNDEQHMSYIDSYLNLDVLMMDAYPFEDGDAYGDISDYMPSSFSSMPDPPPFSDYVNSVRENHCDAQNRPMWVVLQAFGDLETPDNGGYWRQVYPKEIRLQVYLAIMQGAKGIWYFLYESEYPYLLGLLDESGQPTQRLDEVVQINQELNNISSTLLKLNVVADQSPVSIDQGEIKFHVDNSSANHDKYIICVNTDVSSVSNPTISIDKSAIGYSVLSIEDMNTHETFNFNETTDQISFSVTIPEGSGRLLKLSNQIASVNTISQNKVHIYPNPVDNQLHLSYEGNNNLNYEIYNTLGQRVKKGKFKVSTYIIVKNFEKGVYTIKIISDNKSINKKFIVR